MAISSIAEHRPRRRSLVAGWPTALILAALLGTAYWGHRTEWRFLQAAQPASVPVAGRSILVEDGPRGQRCVEHGLPVCPTCDPAVAQKSKPTVPTDADRERVRRAFAARDRAKIAPNTLSRPRFVRFPSAEAVDAAGIDVSPVWSAALTESVAGSGELVFDPTHVARVTTRSPGTAWRIFKQPGDAVQKGELLALVDSAEVGRAKADLQVALVHVRLRAKAARDIVGVPVDELTRTETAAALREAELRLVSAEQALVNLGLSPRAAELRELADDRVAERLRQLGVPAAIASTDAVPATLLPVTTPLAGVVLRVESVAGEPVDFGRAMFVVADARQLRLVVHVPPADAQWIKVGQEAKFRSDGSGVESSGRVTSIGIAAGEVTRAVPVWADVPNPRGTLRASTLGAGRVVIRVEPEAVLVPVESMHVISGTSVVFVRDKRYLDDDGPKAFHVRVIVPGARDGAKFEVIAGVVPGEVVATKGSALLADELRKALAGGPSHE